LTGKHPFDPKVALLALMLSIREGLNVQLPGVKPEVVALVKSMVSVNAEERPESASAVFDEFCKGGFAFFEGIDAVAIRVELARFGVVDKFEADAARVNRVNVELKAKNDGLERLLTPQALQEFNLEALKAEILELKAANAEIEQLLTPQQRLALQVKWDQAENRAQKAKTVRLLALAPAEKLLEYRAGTGDPEAQFELGQKVLHSDPERARTLLQKCEFPKAKELLWAISIFVDSIVVAHAGTLKEWLPWMKGAKLLLRRSGSDQAGVDAFHAAAIGQARTLLFFQTADGKWLCGGFLAPAWPGKDSEATDARRESFLFSLVNQLGRPPAKFPALNDHVAFWSTSYFGFSGWDLFLQPGAGVAAYNGGCFLTQDATLFFGVESNKHVPIGTWELWKVE
jgi:hypothetical protein